MSTPACTAAKAEFRMRLFYAPWAFCRKGDDYCALGHYLPTEVCKGDSTVAMELLEKISQCLEANKGNTAKCEKLLNKYSTKYCSIPEVEEKVRKILFEQQFFG